MACMCGDICCSSCGPAQGNFRCPVCHEWASEGCDHLDETTGIVKPEWVAEAERIVREEAENEARIQDEIDEAERRWNEREKYDDDGVEYADPRDVREERLNDDDWHL